METIKILLNVGEKVKTTDVVYFKTKNKQFISYNGKEIPCEISDDDIFVWKSLNVPLWCNVKKNDNGKPVKKNGNPVLVLKTPKKIKL